MEDLLKEMREIDLHSLPNPIQTAPIKNEFWADEFNKGGALDPTTKDPAEVTFEYNKILIIN